MRRRISVRTPQNHGYLTAKCSTLLPNDVFAGTRTLAFILKTKIYNALADMTLTSMQACPIACQ